MPPNTCGFDASSRIFVAGHRGLVGSAIVRHLDTMGCLNLLVAARSELDLCDQDAVTRFFARTYARIRIPSGSQGWRDHGECHPARAIPSRQSRH